MKKILASAAIAAALLAARAANADTYLLNIDHCTGGCAVPAGNVYVTQNGVNTINFDVELTGSHYFNEAGGGNSFDSVLFSLVGTPSVTFSNISNTNFTGVNYTSGGLNGDGFGSFYYAVNYTGKNGNFNGGPIQSLKFDVTATGLTPNSLILTGGTKVAVDIASVTTDGTNTGLVGGTLQPGGVPEPASWALMIMGFFGMGALIRRRNVVAA